MQSLTLYKRLLKYVTPYRRMAALMIAATAVYAVTNAIYAAQLQSVLDEGFIKKDMGAILTTIIIVITVTIFRGIGFFVSNYTSRRVSSDIVLSLRKEMFSHLQRLPTKYFDRVNSGKTLSRFNYDVLQVTDAATNAVITLVREGVLIISLLGYLLYQNWKLTLLIFALVPIIFFIIRAISNRLRKLAKRIQGNMGTMNHILDENIKGQKIVKIYNGSEHEYKKFDSVVHQIRNASIKSEVTTSSGTPIIELMLVCVICAVIWLMALETKAGNLTPGQFFSYIVMMALLPSPIKKLMRINEYIQRGLAASNDIFAFLDEVSEPETSKQISEKTYHGELQFHQVNFAYTEQGDKVLHHFDLHVPAGQTVALVGASGSGKSSIASLIPRFYDVSNGKITLDGTNIQNIPLSELRQQIAFVNQDTVLFDDSVSNNIAYGSSSIDNDRVKKAAQLAQAEDFILEMQNGYDSNIGEAGQRLSGGQKQRLAIARALYKDAPILILDEATSALDSESEKLVQKALDELLHDRTAIVIAHRLSTIQNADRIVVLDKGCIVEAGTHAELMAKKGRFYQLNNGQKGTATPSAHQHDEMD